MAEGGTQSLEHQKNDISALLETPLKRKDTWYLIDTKWFKQWKKYVGYDTWDTGLVGDECANPGPIDNTPLFKEGSKDQLREHLIEELEYILMPEPAWEKLVSWYGLAEGQTPVARQVIEQGMFVKHCKVEVYLMDLKLCENADIDKDSIARTVLEHGLFTKQLRVEVYPPEFKFCLFGQDEESCITHTFSRGDLIDNIEKEMRTCFTIDKEKEVRLWSKYMSNTYEHLSKPDNTVQDAGLYQGQVIVIEQKNDDGSWPRQTKTASSAIHNTVDMEPLYSSTSSSTRSSSTSYGTYGTSSSSSSSSNYYSQDSSYRSSASPGLCGLSNLGNTCFMNSALQCMSNVPQLTEYFLSEKWREELNVDNPLGMKGEIASSYAELIRNIWSGKYSYTVPRNFKVAVGRFAPQFSGYQQQDSQELMAFLLDGLHEDLNRIKKKPYVEVKDHENMPDEAIAREAWTNYMKRNDSVIVDTFHGLLKSTLVCPECEKVSVTFDPFCYLSLPLPIKKERQIEVFLIPSEPQRKTRHYKLTVPKQGVVRDLCKALSKLTMIPEDKMVVTDVYNHRFHKVLSPDEGLSHILDRDDIFIYEVPVNSGDDPNTLILPVYMRERRTKQGCGNNYQHTSPQLFGQPLLVAIPRNNCTYDVLYNCVLNKMARYVKIPDDNDEWWKVTKKDDCYTNGEVEMNNDSSSSDTEDSTSTSTTTTNATTAEPSTADANDAVNADLVNEADRKPYLFTFHMVNSYGSAEVETIRNDGHPIKFSNRSYVAIDWHQRAKELFYDEKAAEDLEVDDSVSQRTVQKHQTIQLTECLELFTTTEKLGEQDPWYCPRCKKHQQATKKFDLWDLPQVLVIHLKRFSYNRYWRDKLDTFVEYPTRSLSMKKYVINPAHGSAVYDLIAVANHYGGMGGGHYTAFGKSKDDNTWYHFDDSSVSQTTEDSSVTKAGYVLVYQRREPCATPKGRAAAAAAGAATIGEPMSNGSSNHSNSEDMDVS